MKTAIPFMMLLALATAAGAAETEPKLDPAEAKELAKVLDGKVAGKPRSCIAATNSTNLRALGDHVLVYRASKSLVYRNDLVGTCHGLRRGDALVLNVYGSQYCRGDIAQVVDFHSGIWSGTCALGDFVPYRAAAAEPADKPTGGGR